MVGNIMEEDFKGDSNIHKNKGWGTSWMGWNEARIQDNEWK